MEPRPALLLIDFINAMEFDGGEALAPRAVAAARHTQRLKHRAVAAGTPVVYVNDNFGDWSGSFEAVLKRSESAERGRALVELLRPDAGDRSILKPRHSAFYGTPLEFLLDGLGIDSLILTGLQAHICVLFTAHDAYLRRYRIWVPRDCVASERPASEQSALQHIAEVAGADTRPASRLAEDARLSAAFEGQEAARQSVLQRGFDAQAMASG